MRYAIYEETPPGAVEFIKNWSEEEKLKGVEYIKSKWTSAHYAENLEKGIQQLL